MDLNDRQTKRAAKLRQHLYRFSKYGNMHINEGRTWDENTVDDGQIVEMSIREKVNHERYVFRYIILENGNCYKWVGNRRRKNGHLWKLMPDAFARLMRLEFMFDDGEIEE